MTPRDTERLVAWAAWLDALHGAIRYESGRLEEMAKLVAKVRAETETGIQAERDRSEVTRLLARLGVRQ